MNVEIKLYSDFLRKDFSHFLAISLLSIFPILFFIGTGVLNLGIIILDLIFITEVVRKKKIYFLKNYIFYSLIILWLTFLLNIITSIDPSNSFNRGFGFLRFIFFVMALIYYFNIHKKIYQKFILSSWLIIFSITSVDLLFELISGKNILGFESYIHGRLAGFFNDELIIGHFYYAFVLIIISFLLSKFLNKKINIYNKQFDLKNFIYFFIIFFFNNLFFYRRKIKFYKGINNDFFIYLLI